MCALIRELKQTFKSNTKLTFPYNQLLLYAVIGKITCSTLLMMHPYKSRQMGSSGWIYFALFEQMQKILFQMLMHQKW